MKNRDIARQFDLVADVLEINRAKTEANILKGIAALARAQARMPLARARPLARELAGALAGVRGVREIAVAGSIRRGRDTVGDMDILVTSSEPAAVMEAFASRPAVADLIARGATKSSARHRDGIQVDLRAIERSRQHNIRIAVEINAHPDRLDLDDRQARRAVELGALVAISTDAHRAGDLANAERGVAVARRAWIEPARVVNTRPLEALREWIAQPRPAAAGSAR
jgi:predicted nucleotidyltransferase